MPSLLRASFHEKVWGSTHLEPWLPDPDRKIGEVWFEHEPALPVLIKFLFTSERLSVQVHPGDDYAAKHENSRGKTEMWHVLRADAGAPGVAAGLREELPGETLRELAASGEIEKFLNWIPVKQGDTIFVPAGTIHAIGPGLALCEIQQHSDVTYRLYDYGRGRDLHLNRAVDVAVAGPYQAGEARPGFLAYCPYFAVQELRVRDGAAEIAPKQDRFELFVAAEGAGQFGNRSFQCGQVWHTAAGEERFRIEASEPALFLRVFVP